MVLHPPALLLCYYSQDQNWAPHPRPCPWCPASSHWHAAPFAGPLGAPADPLSVGAGVEAGAPRFAVCRPYVSCLLAAAAAGSVLLHAAAAAAAGSVLHHAAAAAAVLHHAAAAAAAGGSVLHHAAAAAAGAVLHHAAAVPPAVPAAVLLHCAAPVISSRCCRSCAAPYWGALHHPLLQECPLWVGSALRASSISFP